MRLPSINIFTSERLHTSLGTETASWCYPPSFKRRHTRIHWFQCMRLARIQYRFPIIQGQTEGVLLCVCGSCQNSVIVHKDHFSIRFGPEPNTVRRRTSCHKWSHRVDTHFGRYTVEVACRSRHPHIHILPHYQLVRRIACWSNSP